MTDVFEKFVKVSTEENGINPLYCVSLPGYTYQCASKYTVIKIQNLQDIDLILVIENKIRGGISSVMGDRNVKSVEKNIYMDATNLYGPSMSQMLPYDEINFEKDICLEEISNNPDDNDIGYFIEVVLKYPDDKKEKTKNCPFCPEKKFISEDEYSDYMIKIKPKTYTKSKKVVCDWTEKSKCLIQYRMLMVHLRLGKVVKKFHEVISFKQSKWLDKILFLIHKNETELKMILRNYLLMLLLVNF